MSKLLDYQESVPVRRRRRGIKRLLQMILLAIILFFALVFLEDYLRGVFKSWQTQREKIQNEETVKETVKNYNEILMTVYQRQKADLLREVTTEDELERVRLYLTYNYYEKKQALRSHLNNLEVTTVKLKGRRATVRTKEDWTYRYLDINTQKPTTAEKRARYEVTYSLEKRGKRWLVAKLELLK